MTTLDWSRARVNDDDGRPQQARAQSARLGDIDRAKGLAIILVVLGHIVAREPPIGHEWYAVLRSVLYSFHMPFFMYLGGVVLFHSGNALSPRPDYRGYLFRRAERLLLPFVLFGLLIVFGKIAARHFLYVDNDPGSIAAGLTALVWDTAHSPATSVWYIFVLFVYCMITPLLLRLVRGLIWPLIVLAAALYLLAIPGYFYLDRVAHYYLFFAIGLAVGRHLPAATPMIDRYYPAFALLFIAALTLVAFDVRPDVSVPVSSLLSIPALHGLMRQGSLAQSKLLLWIGGYSFVIYLLNTILIGLTKGALLKIMPWDGSNFLLFAPALMAAGLLGPIVIKRFVLRRVPFSDRMTD